MNLSPLDLAIVVAYLVTIAGIGLWMARGPATAQRYFVADRQVPRWVVGFTLMATLISSNTVVAHPGIAFQKGLVLVPGFLVLPLILFLVAHYVVPFYRRVVGMSAYEYIGRRFGLGGRLYTSFGFLLERTFDLGVTLVTTALALHAMTGWDLGPTILALAAFTLAYTSIGGIRAVVWTDAVQGVLLIGGGLLILLRLLFAPEAGAPFAVLAEAWRGGRLTLGSTELSWRSLMDSENRTLWIFLVAMTLQWSRRFVCDQHMVQRYLIAKTDADARQGALMGAWLSLPVLLLFNLIGACLYGFYRLSQAAQPALGDQVLPTFIVDVLPAGVVGLLLAAILAASMSSMSSDLNSLATVITGDYLQRFFPRWSDRALLRSGRLAVVAVGAIAAAVAGALMPSENSTPIAETALTLAVIISGGSLGLFCLGFLTRRATRTGAYVGIGACLLFTAWGVLTEASQRFVDLGSWSFPLNSILIGVFGHVVLFCVGYAASLLLGGYRPADLDQLVLRGTAAED